MATKTYIYIGIFIGSIVGGWLGSFLDHGNLLGVWGFVLGTLGSIGGVFVGYRLGQ